MELLSNKNTGDPLPATEWNQVPKEEENVITNTGQALSNGDTNQLGKGIAQYVANGNFYTDSGAGNAYILTQIGLKQVTPAYVDGMIIEFIPGNTNTGSATVNVASLGVKNISNTSSGGEIASGTRISMRYNNGTGEFEIFQTAAAPVTAGLIFGLIMSNAADADHDITIATGQAADSTNAFLMQLSAAMTKQIDAVWAAGNNAGGLFSGAVAIDTWYHVFEIRKDSDGTIDIGFDTSVSAANIPAGYTAYRRIGSVLTDGSANILGFTQKEDMFYFDSPISWLAAAPPISKTQYDVGTPLGVECIAFVSGLWVSSTAAGAPAYARIFYPNATDAAATSSNSNIASFQNTTSGRSDSSSVQVLTNASSQLSLRASVAYAALYCNTWAYRDFRG
ncbi:MAG: hypothetical protein KAT69_07930 [Candidatus Aminicenantes bacterium]|nr:hypothetical protein [Candidatus Aminicenantes bacterium]